MSTETNKNHIRRLTEEGWNQGSVDVFDQVFAQDFVHYDSRSPDVRTGEEYKQWCLATRTAFPDFHVMVDDMIAEGDKVAVRWTIQGTQQGELVTPQGVMPPSGRQVHSTGMTMFRFANDKLVEDWHMPDSMTFFQQLGLMPMPEQAGR